jgi:hypothetical protein
VTEIINVTADPTRRYGQPNIDFDPTDPDTIVYVVQTTAYTAAGHATGDPRCDQNVYWGQTRAQIENERGFTIPAVFTSRDAGATWEKRAFPVPAAYPALSTFGNATVAAGPDGTFYLSFLGIEWFKGLPYPLTHAGNFVSTSTDGGRTWSEPVLVHTPLDHPRVVVDPTTGRIYQSSGDRATAYPSPATEADPDVPFGDDWDRFTVASDDGITWTTPRPWGGGIEHDNFSQVYVSAANGLLAGVSQHVGVTGLGLGIDDAGDPDDSEPRRIVFQTTADDGETWSTHEVPVRADATGYTVPSVAADPARPGHFVVAVMNGTRSYGAKELLMGTYPAGTDVLLYETTDGGETWVERVIATDPGLKRKLWVSFSRDGVLAVLWVADQPGPARSWTVPPIGPPFDDEPASTEETDPYHVRLALSLDGGTTFGDTITVTTQPSPPWDAYGAIGDANPCVVMTQDTAYVAWGDWSPPGSLGNPGDDCAGFFRSIRFR